MTSALEGNCAKVVVVEDDDRRRRWRIQSPIPERLQPRQENTIEALEIAARAARDENRLRHARALEDLRDSLITRLSPRDALRSEADAEAEIGRAHVCTPVTNAHLVCRLLLEKKKRQHIQQPNEYK